MAVKLSKRFVLALNLFYLGTAPLYAEEGRAGRAAEEARRAEDARRMSEARRQADRQVQKQQYVNADVSRAQLGQLNSPSTPRPGSSGGGRARGRSL